MEKTATFSKEEIEMGQVEKDLGRVWWRGVGEYRRGGVEERKRAQIFQELGTLGILKTKEGTPKMGHDLDARRRTAKRWLN